MSIRVILVAILSSLAGCVDFTVPAGHPCDDRNGCPVGQSCQVGVCTESIAPTPDAGVTTSTPDASSAPDATVTVAMPGPDTSITVPLPGATVGATVMVAFTASGDSLSFECHMDTDPYASCASGQSFSLVAGPHTFFVRSITAALARGPEATRNFIVDTTGPATTLAGTPAAGALTSSSGANLTFTATPAGATFECSLDGVAFAACTSPVTLTALPDGAHVFSVRGIANGVTGGAASRGWTVDTTPPSVAILAPVTSASAPAQGREPTLSGSAESGATVAIYIGASCTGSHTAATTATQGTWSLPLDSGTQAAANGATSYYAQATDAAGNTTCTTAFVYTTDNSAPAVAITGTSPVGPTRSRTPTISGTAENGATVTLTLNSDCSGAAVGSAVANGTFAIPVTTQAAADGTTTYYAKAVDAAGNSACSAGIAYVTDNTPPVVTLASTTPATTAGSPTMNLSPTVSGGSENGAAIAIFTAAGCTGSVAGSGVAANQSFAIAVTSPATPSGTTTYYAQATDAAGNSACSSGIAYYTDNSAPAVAITGSTPATSVSLPAMTRSPTVSGNAPSGATVTLYTASSCSGTSYGSMLATGTFAIAVTTPVAADGTTTFYARAVDGAGNSSCSGGFAYHTDNTAPSVSIGATNPPSSSASPTRTRTPTVSGSAEASSTVVLYTASTCTGSSYGTVVATAGGTFAIASAQIAADGTTSYYALATDAAGNHTCSAVFHYYTDNTPPASVTIATTPSTTTSARTANRLPTVSGSTEANASIAVFGAASCAGTAYGTGTASATGAYSVATTVQALADNTTTYSVRATDAAGNSTCSVALPYYTDNTPPAVSIGSSTPATSSTQPTRTLAPILAGTSEAGAQITLYVGVGCATAVGSGTASAGGTFSIAVSSNAAANGGTTYYAIAKDAAGNASACATGITYYTDTTPPDTSILGTPLAVTKQTTASFTYSATESGSIFTCQLDSNAAAGCATTGITYSSLAGGSHTFKVHATDFAGNADATPASYSWTVDLVPPVITFTQTPPAADASATGSFVFTLNEGGTASCHVDSDAWTACTPGAAFAYAKPWGPHIFYVQAVDTAGNVSAVKSFAWSIDICVDATNGNDGSSGTCAAPYKSITKSLAVSAAGQTILVKPGNYQTSTTGETFPLTVNGKTLIGDESTKGSSTTVGSSGSSPDYVFELSNGAVLAGFYLASSSDDLLGGGIQIDGAGVIARNDTIASWGSVGYGYGILVGSGASGAVLDGNDILNFRKGCGILAGGPVKVQHNDVRENAIGVQANVATADLGGGASGSAGGNAFSCNSAEDVTTNYAGVLSAANNLWDHDPPTQSTTLNAGYDFVPYAGSSINAAGAQVAASPCP